MKKNFIKCFERKNLFAFLLILFIFTMLSVDAQTNFDFDFSFNKYQFYNGERLTMTPKINYSKSPNGAAFVKIDYFWDDELISTEYSSPYALNYKLSNKSVGKHTLKVAVYATGINLPTFGPFNFDYTISILGSFSDDPTEIAENPTKAEELGNKYYYGKGVAKSFSQAFYWYKVAAEKDKVFAQTMLAFMYFNAQGTRKDVDASIYWNKKAANNGSWYAWSQLGHIYQELRNYNEALFCFKKASECPNDKEVRRNAKYRVGRLYDAGLGVSVNLAEAKRWYKESADEGYEYAINRLNQLGGYSKPEPKPNPNSNMAKLTWLSSTSETKMKNYHLKIGINSTSKVEDVTIYLNNEVFRGINAVKNDGYTSSIEKTLSLTEGNNLIKVSVKNASGISSIEKTIKVKSDEVQPNYNDRRIALIIGNSNYKGDNKLPNPVNDATDIANKLEKLGFHVIRALDQTKKGMESAMVKFGQQATNYDVALFYYAGHGIRCEGVNYLVPIDADLPDETSVKYNCTNANMVLDYMDKANCKMKIVILDACRNNPFERSWHRGLDGGGLSIMNAPVGTFIAFSTAPGTVASDGKIGQRNSPYTSALLEMLEKPNLSLTDLFQEVLEKVAQKTNDKQIPWTSNSFRGKFYFNKK